MSKNLILLISFITLDNVILLQLVLDKLNLVPFTIYNLLGSICGIIIFTYYYLRKLKKGDNNNEL